MQSRSFPVLAIIFILLLAIGASAEEYTLDKCIATALENNYGIIAAQNNYKSSRWSLYSAYGAILPSASISGSRSTSWSSSTGENTGYGAGISLGVSYSGLGVGTIASISQSKAQYKSDYYSYIDTKNTLVLTIKDAYFNVTRAKMLVDVSKDALKRTEEQLKIAQSKYDLGSASLSDVLKAKVSLGNAKLDLLSAENEYELAKADLSSSMGIDVNAEIEIVEEFPSDEFNLTYDAALNEALSRNPAYRKAEYDLAATKASRWQSRTSFLPSISFSLSHSTSVNKYGDLFDFEKENAGYSYGVSLSYNLFNGFSDVASVKSANYAVNTSRESLANEKNTVALEIKQAYLDIQKNSEQLKVTEESVAAAQEDLNIVREKYKLGAATMVEVLDAEVSFKEAQISQVEAKFDYHLAISQLEKAMGK